MFIEIIGWIGAGGVLLAYLLVSTRKIAPTSKEYQLINLFGALGIIINSAVHVAIPISSTQCRLAPHSSVRFNKSNREVGNRS